MTTMFGDHSIEFPEKHMSHKKKTPDVTCSFCKESGFDMVGLKNHIERGWCEVFNETPRDYPEIRQCECGHSKSSHIYEEGACRPGGLACECQRYKP